MKIRIEFRREDLLNGEEVIMHDIDALYDDERLLYPEGNGFMHRIFFMDDEVVIERRGNGMQSRISLKKNTRGTAEIDAGYGVMILETELAEYTKTADGYCVLYRIFSGEGTVTHQRLRWRKID